MQNKFEAFVLMVGASLVGGVAAWLVLTARKKLWHKIDDKVTDWEISRIHKEAARKQESKNT